MVIVRGRFVPLLFVALALAGCLQPEAPGVRFSPREPVIGDDVTARFVGGKGEVWFTTFSGPGGGGAATGGLDIRIGTLTRGTAVMVRSALAEDGEWRRFSHYFLGPNVTDETRVRISMPERVDLSAPLRIEVNVSEMPNSTVWLVLSFVARSSGAATAILTPARAGDVVVAEVDLPRRFDRELAALQTGDEFVLDVILRERSSFSWTYATARVL